MVFYLYINTVIAIYFNTYIKIDFLISDANAKFVIELSTRFKDTKIINRKATQKKKNFLTTLNNYMNCKLNIE